MTLRRQLPVHSPIGVAALVQGAASLGGNGEHSRTLLRRILRERFGPVDLLLTDSGTTALALALGRGNSGGVSRPCRVALPAYGCYDLATAADGAGADVVLYDLDPFTLGPDRDSLRRALSRQPAVLVGVELYGIPLDWSWLRAELSGSDTLLVEDAALGAGASWQDRPLGSNGSLSVLSFGRGKGWTGGGGGALLAHDDRGRELLLNAASQLAPAGPGMGMMISTAAQWLLARPAWYGIPAAIPALHLGQTRYLPVGAPHGISGFSAAVLVHTAEAAEHEALVRRRTAARYAEVLGQGASVAQPIRADVGTPGYIRYPVLLSSGQPALTKPIRALGVTRSYPLALADLPGFTRRVENATDPFPGARRLAADLITLPTHSRLTESDRAAIVRWLGALPATN